MGRQSTFNLCSHINPLNWSNSNNEAPAFEVAGSDIPYGSTPIIDLIEIAS